MSKFTGAVLLLSACAAIAFAQKPSTRAAHPSENASVSQTLQQMERDWIQSEKTMDVAKLGRILAEDWVGIGPGGELRTKQQYLAGVKSGANKMESYEVGPMSVKVLGSVAVVQGSDTEKSATNGALSTTKYAWMDVFVKRGGKWFAVRSQAAVVR